MDLFILSGVGMPEGPHLAVGREGGSHGGTVPHSTGGVEVQTRGLHGCGRRWGETQADIMRGLHPSPVIQNLDADLAPRSDICSVLAQGEATAADVLAPVDADVFVGDP